VIIIDTNVISELMRAKPDPAILGWFRHRPLAELATTAINLAEIRHGLARLPFGRRRRELEATFNSLAARGFADRVFDFDSAAAEVFGDLVVARERAGRRLEGFDGLIAAIARSRGLPIATRNVDDFQGCGIVMINPWRPTATDGQR
jgi:predicted nucleic acid-binding protein